MWREAVTRPDGRPPKTDDNVTGSGRVTGNSKAYTVSRLKRCRNYATLNILFLLAPETVVACMGSLCNWPCRPDNM